MDVNAMCSPLGSIKAGILMQNYVRTIIKDDRLEPLCR